MEEFIQEVDEKEKIVNCKRMKVKKMDVEKGIFTWVLSSLLLVTFKGPNVPENISIYNGLAKIPVKPYVDSVVQCFQCYSFGHCKRTNVKRKKYV